MEKTGTRGGRGYLTEEEKQNRPKITRMLLKRIFSYLLPYWLKLLLVFATIVVSSILGLLPAIITGKIIDEGLIGRNFDRLTALIAISVAVLIASNLMAVLESYFNTSVTYNITYDMRNLLYSHLQKVSIRFFSSSKQGDIITRMTSDISGIEDVILGTLTNTLKNSVILITAIIIMFQQNWLLALVGIAIVPLFVIPTKRVGKNRWMITLKAQEKNDEINQILNETLSISGQLLLKLFTNEQLEYSKYQSSNREMTRLRIKESLAGRWFRLSMSTYTGVAPMLIYLAGGILMLKYGDPTLSVGDITVMVALLGRMYQPVNSLLSIHVDLIRSLAMFTRIFEYFDMPLEIKNKPDAVTPDKMNGNVEFEHVNFSYNEGQPKLKNICFSISAGSSVAIVGPSGSGKSTLINLIPRLYDVTGGRIMIDGRDIRDLDLEFLRKSIGVVTQDTYLFNGTIKENLLYAKADATVEDLVKACREANIHDFIAGLPEGYETLVGNRGVKLSGGEKQRVSIARVILKNPELIILDEATSSLDSISECYIQDAIEPLLSGRTSIIIAHRLSTIMAADEIMVLKCGEIVERGTHEELLSREGVYNELYETQFRHALEDNKEHPGQYQQ
jgi:ATP-binding cassette, subfamily B, bacterial